MTDGKSVLCFGIAHFAATPFSPDCRSDILPASRETMGQETHQRALRHPPGRDAVRTLNSDRRAVELGDGKSFEILSGIVVTLVAQNAERHSLAEPHPLFGIRPPVNSREVASESDVRGELVDFAADREPRILADRDWRRPIHA